MLLMLLLLQKKFKMYNNNYNQQLSMLDIMSVISFFISVMNFGENLSQSDKQDLQADLQKNVDKLLNEIHNHLQRQDDKIDIILAKLEELSNDGRRNI